ncbi:MAG: FAD-linked oxidase C-terminal domain-containing protein, partial [Pseudomonadota bacterium]|nr:FAD-linked oxidase C-terminal domain-containing protein [Pseudomonadota bacterium]
MKGMNTYNPDMNMAEKPYLFLEFHGSPAGVEEQVASFRDIAEEFGVQDFEWASKTEDRNRLWAARHSAYYAGKSLRPGAEGVVTDVCVPISELAECIRGTQEDIAASGLIAPLVGHVGDGNFHLLILVDPESDDELKRAKELAHNVCRRALASGGTVTGEHGVGTGKMRYMEEEHGPAYAVMAQLKKSLDPNNLMNPGKMVQVN